MPTMKPRVQVMMDPVMYEKIAVLAKHEGRSLSNFVEHHLRRLVAPDLTPVFPRAHARQIDIAEAIAKAVRKGPASSPRRAKVK